MNKVTTIGIDLAKQVFQVSVLDRWGKQLSNKSMSRARLIEYLSQLPPTVIGMEACGTAHYWSGKLTAMGHTVKLFPPIYINGLVYGNKTDVNDARAIALAATQPVAPTVQAKTPDQLTLQGLLRVRERRIGQRTRCTNQIRGLLLEHGVVIAKGIRHVRQLTLAGIPTVVEALLEELLCEFRLLDQLVNESDKRVREQVQSHPVGQRLLAIPGFGPVNVLASLVVNPSDYRNGRHYAAWLGLVPRQSGTGGSIRLGGMSKRGNRYHRHLMCHGARAFLCVSKGKNDPLLQWARRIQSRKGTPVAVGALANKLSRISWKVMSGETYCVSKAVTTMN